MLTVADVLLACAIAAFLCGWRQAGDVLLAAGSLIAGVADAADGDWPGSAFSFAIVALLGWDWWRRNRKRSPRSYGAKARALLAALVRKAREAAKPRPVLRPAPGGVRV